MANGHAIIAIIGCFAFGVLSGCVDGSSTAGSEDHDGQSDAANGPPAAEDDHQPPATLPLNRTRNLSFGECNYAKFTLYGAAENFPFASPQGWEDPGVAVEEIVVGRTWVCQEVSAFGVQTFRNVSMLWLGHGNMSDPEDRLDEYAYNDLAAEVVVTADPPEFAEVLGDEWDVRPGKVIIDDGVVVMENPDGRIVLELSRVPLPGSGVLRETVFFIAAAGAQWTELDHAHGSRGFWLHGTVSREGETPLDPWFEQAHSIPVADGYLGYDGTVEVTSFD